MSKSFFSNNKRPVPRGRLKLNFVKLKFCEKNPTSVRKVDMIKFDIPSPRVDRGKKCSSGDWSLGFCSAAPVLSHQRWSSLGSALSIRRWSRHVEANFAVLKECISRQNGARSPFCESYKIYNGRGENFSIASLFFILHIDMNLRHFSYRSTIIAILSVPRSLIAYCFSISIYMYTYIFKIYS